MEPIEEVLVPSLEPNFIPLNGESSVLVPSTVNRRLSFSSSSFEDAYENLPSPVSVGSSSVSFKASHLNPINNVMHSSQASFASPRTQPRYAFNIAIPEYLSSSSSEGLRILVSNSDKSLQLDQYGSNMKEQNQYEDEILPVPFSLDSPSVQKVEFQVILITV